MQDEAIRNDFNAKREWMSKSWLWIVLLFCAVSVYLWLLTFVTAVDRLIMIPLCAVILWWHCTKLGLLCTWNYAGIGLTMRVIARSALLFGVAACWQWMTGRWLVGGALHRLSLMRVFVVVVWAPVMEELAFRVLLLRSTAQARRGLSSIIVMSLANGILFALHHLWNLLTFPRFYVLLQCFVSFLAGFASASHVLVHGESSVVQVMLVHAVNNLFAVLYDPSAVAQLGDSLVWIYVAGLTICNALWIHDTQRRTS